MSAQVYAHALTVNDACNHATNQTCAGNISFDTALELEVEHCTAERPAMSLRASVKNGTEINRYDYLFSMMLVQRCRCACLCSDCIISKCSAPSHAYTVS